MSIIVICFIRDLGTWESRYREKRAQSQVMQLSWIWWMIWSECSGKPKLSRFWNFRNRLFKRCLSFLCLYWQWLDCRKIDEQFNKSKALVSRSTSSSAVGHLKFFWRRNQSSSSYINQTISFYKWYNHISQGDIFTITRRVTTVPYVFFLFAVIFFCFGVIRGRPVIIHRNSTLLIVYGMDKIGVCSYNSIGDTFRAGMRALQITHVPWRGGDPSWVHSLTWRSFTLVRERATLLRFAKKGFQMALWAHPEK